MLDTYKSDVHSVALRQVEVPNYAVLSEVTVLGWEVQVAVSQSRPFILFRAAEWEGRRPRFAVTATQGDHFRKVLQDLSKLTLEKRDQLLTLAYEEPIFVYGGLAAISKTDTEAQKLWKSIAGDEGG